VPTHLNQGRPQQARQTLQHPQNPQYRSTAPQDAWLPTYLNQGDHSRPLLGLIIWRSSGRVTYLVSCGGGKGEGEGEGGTHFSVIVIGGSDGSGAALVG